MEDRRYLRLAWLAIATLAVGASITWLIVRPDLPAEIDADAGGQTLVKLHRPTEQVSNTEILGTDESAAVAVVDILEEIGLI